MAENALPDSLLVASAALDRWIEAEGFRGYDPHDALNSPLLRMLSLRSRLVGIAWLHLLKGMPVNIRPILGIAKGYNPKAMGLFLATYLRKYAFSHESEHAQLAERMASWLRENSAPGFHGACWGYDFPWPNRGFYAPTGTPTVVNTAFVGMAFLDGFKLLGRKDFLEVARSSCDFVLADLARVRGREGFCFAYTPLDRRQVHNANMLGAALLARVGAVTEETELLGVASQAVRFTMDCQQPDGSWYYGVGEREKWIDGFHTGYVLDCLDDFIQAAGCYEYLPQLEAGLAFYLNHFFLENGTPRYYADSTYPVDIHSASQAILTLLRFSDRCPAHRELATRVATWTVGHMQSPLGYFYYQIRPQYIIRIPYMRWAQAWMQRALAELRANARRDGL